MIKFTELNGGHIYLNPNHIHAIFSDDGQTTVVCGDTEYPVKEDPEEVAKRVVSFKHREMQLRETYKEILRTGALGSLIEEEEQDNGKV